MTIKQAEECYNNAFNNGCRPDPVMSVSEWADAYRTLTKSTASEPGPYRTERTPYLREIMDRLSPTDPTTEIVLKKGAQIGGTEAGNNWIGCVIDLFPGPMLVVQPTGDTAKRFSKLRLAPLVASTERLHNKIKEARTRDSGNTIMQKEFPGGTLIITGANSAAGLRSMPIKFMMLDETDAYPADVAGEGNPITLATKRTSSYRNKKKIFKISTPTFEGASHIDKDFRKGSQAQYNVPCPICKKQQVLDFKRLKYKAETIGEEVIVSTAEYACIHCDALIQENKKTWMFDENNGAQWVHKHPKRKIKSYQISALYSPYGWYSWAEACQHFEDSKSDSAELVTFTNTVLGECYEEPGESPDWERLWERAGTFNIGTVPRDAHVLTGGVDVQKDRLELTVKGWGKRKRNWAIDHEVFEGNPADDAVWGVLRDFIENTQYPHASGYLMPISLVAVDSGYHANEVYTFVRKKPKFFAVKGHDRIGPILGNPSQLDIKLKNRVIKRGILVYPFASSVAKKELYSWLSYRTPEDGTRPVGFCEFPKFHQEFFKQLTAERLITRKDKNKYSKQEWVKQRDRNEVLDCSTMARAAAYKLGVDKWTEDYWDKLAKTFNLYNNLEKPPLQEKQTVAEKEPSKVVSKLKRRRVKSKYLTGHGS